MIVKRQLDGNDLVVGQWRVLCVPFSAAQLRLASWPITQLNDHLDRTSYFFLHSVDVAPCQCWMKLLMNAQWQYHHSIHAIAGLSGSSILIGCQPTNDYTHMWSQTDVYTHARTRRQYQWHRWCAMVCSGHGVQQEARDKCLKCPFFAGTFIVLSWGRPVTWPAETVNCSYRCGRGSSSRKTSGSHRHFQVD